MVVDRERESQLSLLARRGFGDPDEAAARLSSAAFGELGQDRQLLDALSRCADPDLALSTLARLLEADPDPQTLRDTLASSKPLRDRLLGVLGVSAALGDFVVRHPESWHVLDEFEVADLEPHPDRFRALMFDAVGVPRTAPPVPDVTGPAAVTAAVAGAVGAASATGVTSVTSAAPTEPSNADNAGNANEPLTAEAADTHAEAEPTADVDTGPGGRTGTTPPQSSAASDADAIGAGPNRTSASAHPAGTGPDAATSDSGARGVAVDGSRTAPAVSEVTGATGASGAAATEPSNVGDADGPLAAEARAEADTAADVDTGSGVNTATDPPQSSGAPDADAIGSGSGGASPHAASGADTGTATSASASAFVVRTTAVSAREGSARAVISATVDIATGGPVDELGGDRPEPLPVATLTGTAAEDALRVAYRKALLSITARDVAASAELSSVAADLADLAGAILEAALAVARAEDPASAAMCRLAVIGMGKCGARELNYLSDVDVIFVAEPVRPGDDPDTATNAGAATNAGNDDAEALRAATRLASRMMRLCSDSTGEGTIWQVDAALRPEGKAGPLVRTLASHAAYYQRWAKTWEFQALLKARPVAGDAALGAAYLAMVGPMVWNAARREHFVDDVQAMRRRVVDHATDSLRRAPGSVAVDRELKLGPGGLRDVEFAVQLLQLVHGRLDESLRVRATLDALAALADGGYVGREDAKHLADAYRFLRTLEHRIQLFRLERTHTMPENPVALRRLGRSMGWIADPASELGDAWRGHAREVRRLHEKLFYRPLLAAVARLDEGSAAGAVPAPVPASASASASASPSTVGAAPRLSAQSARARLEALGYADPAGALANIEALATGISRRAAIQRTLLPVMLGWFADAPDPDAGLLAFRRVSDALGDTPWYLRSLRDEGEAAWRLARVLTCGSYVPDLLLRDPAAVALLGDDNALIPRSRSAIEAEMMAVVERATSAEHAVTAVRAVRRRELFRIVAADLLGLLKPARATTSVAHSTRAGSPGVAGAIAPGSNALASARTGTGTGDRGSGVSASVTTGAASTRAASTPAAWDDGPGAGVSDGSGASASSVAGVNASAGGSTSTGALGGAGAGLSGGAGMRACGGEGSRGGEPSPTSGAGMPDSADPLDVLGRALTDVTEATIEAALAAVIIFRARASAPDGGVRSQSTAATSIGHAATQDAPTSGATRSSGPAMAVSGSGAPSHGVTGSPLHGASGGDMSAASGPTGDDRLGGGSHAVPGAAAGAVDGDNPRVGNVADGPGPSGAGASSSSDSRAGEPSVGQPDDERPAEEQPPGGGAVAGGQSTVGGLANGESSASHIVGETVGEQPGAVTPSDGRSSSGDAVGSRPGAASPADGRSADGDAVGGQLGTASAPDGGSRGRERPDGEAAGSRSGDALASSGGSRGSVGALASNRSRDGVRALLPPGGLRGEVGGAGAGAASAAVSAPGSGRGGLAELAAALPTRLAVIAMGRFGGGELGYGSDADVMFVHEPLAGADEREATTLAFELANELRRLLQTPSPDPPLVIDADLRPEGRQGPLVRSLASYAEYYRRWSRVWESQALLRARPIAGAVDVGERFIELVDPIRYPASGLAEPGLVEVRRLKARMEAERLPRGGERALHTKLGPGGLSDVEWVAQLLQLRYGADLPSLRVTSTRAVLAAAYEAGLITDADRALLDDAWYQTSRTRNGITLARGRPADQLPTAARDLAVIARYLDSWHPADGSADAAHAGASNVAAPNVGGLLLDRQRLDHQALVDAHRRRARRARVVFERLFYGREIGDR